MTRKKVIVVGAGPGGLSAAMILAAKGFDVEVFEKADRVGGRNSPVRQGGFTFDLGPTFVMLPQVFEEVFALAGKKLSDYLDFRRLDPLYRLRFADGRDFSVRADTAETKKEIARLFPGEEAGYERWLKKHRRKFDWTYACLKEPYDRVWHYLRPEFLKALLVMQNHKSVHGVLAGYFKSEELRMALAFQAKYLGMSPWDCPGAFSILSYSEHGYGVFHPMGGVFKISEAMAGIVRELGGQIRLNSPVKEIIVEGKTAKGVILEGGEKVSADAVIMNADFAYGMTTLVPEAARPSYTDAKLKRMRYSCSTLMFYFGVDKRYDIPHHNVYFSGNYRLNVDEIFQGKGMPSEPSFYIQNACATDPSLAPKGKSTIYVLVPVSNLKADFPWQARKKELRDYIVGQIMKRTELTDLADHIETEGSVAPPDWRDRYGVYNGATFNLAHNLTQMLYLRPHNDYDDIERLYIVGGGTHPGSGLPTILESGRIAAEMIGKRV